MGIVASSVQKLDYNKPVTDITNEFVVRNMMSCNSNTETSQVIEISGLKCKGNMDFSNFSQSSVTAPEIKCVQNNLSNASQINRLKSDLKAGLQKETDGVVIGANISVDVQAFINEEHTKIVNAVTSESSMTCIQNSIQSQIIKIKNNEIEGDCKVSNLIQNITNNAVLNCKQANTVIQDAQNRIQTVLDTTYKGKISGVTLSWLKWGVYILGALIVLYAMYKFSGSGSGRYGYPPVPYAQYVPPVPYAQFVPPAQFVPNQNPPPYNPEQQKSVSYY